MNPGMETLREIKLGENLKRILSERKLSITETAKIAGMHKSTLHGYCQGVIPRNVIQLRDLADFLGMDLTELLFGNGGIQEPLAAADIEGRYEVSIRRIR
jgi:transcriptional regulator with XRE-family HTH domain